MTKLTREQQIAALEKDWAENPRWKLVKRGYSAADVVPCAAACSPSTRWPRTVPKSCGQINGGAEGYVNAFGAITAGQAMQQAKAGLEAVYLSGWQVAADGNTSEPCTRPVAVRLRLGADHGAPHQQHLQACGRNPVGRGINPGDKDFVDYFLPPSWPTPKPVSVACSTPLS